MPNESDRLAKELDSFQNLWQGGYFEGDPLEPLTSSSYGELGYISVLHATYLACIKPYINQDTVALEIGPGRGAWTGTLLDAKEVYCLDALSAEHNGFWEYVGQQSHVHYFQVSDFACAMLPDNHFNYLFSFGALCHVSFEGITAYMQNLYPKLKRGAHAFIMIADYDKFNAAYAALDRNSVLNAIAPLAATRAERNVWRLFRRLRNRGTPQEIKDPNEDTTPSPGRWYHAGTERTCAMLQAAGYTILDSDMGTVLRDPIIHFTK